MAEQGLGAHFHCPALSPVPEEAIAQAETIIARTNAPITLVGSSLGGHYATYLAEKHDLQALLINPAVIEHIQASHFIGTHHNYHSGAEFEFTAAHAAQLDAQTVSKPTPERYFLLLETGDEVLDYRHASVFYGDCRRIVHSGGDHSFVHFPETIPQILQFACL